MTKGREVYLSQVDARDFADHPDAALFSDDQLVELVSAALIDAKRRATGMPVDAYGRICTMLSTPPDKLDPEVFHGTSYLVEIFTEEPINDARPAIAAPVAQPSDWGVADPERTFDEALSDRSAEAKSQVAASDSSSVETGTGPAPTGEAAETIEQRRERLKALQRARQTGNG